MWNSAKNSFFLLESFEWMGPGGVGRLGNGQTIHAPAKRKTDYPLFFATPPLATGWSKNCQFKKITQESGDLCKRTFWGKVQIFCLWKHFFLWTFVVFFYVPLGWLMQPFSPHCFHVNISPIFPPLRLSHGREGGRNSLKAPCEHVCLAEKKRRETTKSFVQKRGWPVLNRLSSSSPI